MYPSCIQNKFFSMINSHWALTYWWDFICLFWISCMYRLLLIHIVFRTASKAPMWQNFVFSLCCLLGIPLWCVVVVWPLIFDGYNCVPAGNTIFDSLDSGHYNTYHLWIVQKKWEIGKWSKQRRFKHNLTKVTIE